MQVELADPRPAIAAGLVAAARLALEAGVPSDRLAGCEEQAEAGGGSEHHSTTTASPAWSRNAPARPPPRDRAPKGGRMPPSLGWRRRTKMRCRRANLAS